MKKLSILFLFTINFAIGQSSSEIILDGTKPIFRATGFGTVSGFTQRAAIYGHTGNTSTTSNTIGVLGYSTNSSTVNYGLYGYANGSLSTFNVGTFGRATVNIGQGYGMRGEASSNSISADLLYGGEFQAFANSGTNGAAVTFGVYGRSSGTAPIVSSFGLYGLANGNNTVSSHGIYGESNSTGSSNEFGGLFIARGSSTGSLKIGVQAKSSGTTSTDFRYGIQSVVDGPSSQNSFGIHSFVDNSGNGESFGGYFDVTGTGSGNKYGIYATAGGSGSRFAGYFDGKVTIGNATTNYQLGVVGGTNNSISTTGIVGIGLPTGLHITMDGDDIDTWNNTASTKLFLNYNSQGDVQIGRTSGTSSLTLPGEINRPSTDNANLLPIAYGNINFDGTVNAGSTINISCVKSGTGIYDITITGETYDHTTYTTVASINSTIFGFIRTLTTSPGKLRIYTANTSGTASDIGFTFVVYKK